MLKFINSLNEAECLFVFDTEDGYGYYELNNLRYQDGLYIVRDEYNIKPERFKELYINWLKIGQSCGDDNSFYGYHGNDNESYVKGVYDAFGYLDGYEVYEVKDGKLV